MTIKSATPGPWTHNDGNPTRIIGPDDETVAVLYGGEVGLDLQFANAALIAAAPALYAYVADHARRGDAEALCIVNDLEGGGIAGGRWAYNDFNPRKILEGASTTIASVFGGMGGDAVQLANTKLIGAAPAMLEYARGRSQRGDESAEAILAVAASRQGAGA